MKNHTNIEQGTSAWHQMRKGKITGTTLKSIMGTPKSRRDAIYEMVAQRLTVGVDDDYENPIDRGHRLEPEAIAAFELKTGLTVTRTGFCESDELESSGYSPDGIIFDDTDVEVKCLLGKNYVKMWLDNKVPYEYFWQLVWAFVINPKLQKRYFIGYNPDIPSHPLHIIEVNREEVAEYIEQAKVKHEEFIADVNNILKNIIKL